MPREAGARKSPKRETATNGTEKAERESAPAAPEKADTSGKIEEIAATPKGEKLDPIRIFTLLPIRVYHHIADVGAGPGYLTIPLAKYAYEGKVYAIDAQQSNLETISQKAARARLSNVATMASKDNKIPLADASVDGVFISSVLQESRPTPALLKEIARILKPNGWASMVEWRKSPNGMPPPEDRLTNSETIQMARDAGMRIVAQRDLNAYYFVLLKK
ncbi:MAG: class I SAM-dependent methyltransferase [Chloroflexi bacterium]|nr:class I SAM-dependent methyltransferase [Chloroflexota bacterium]